MQTLNQAPSHSSGNQAHPGQVVQQFFAHVSAREFGPLSSLVSPRIDWYIFESPYLPWTGKRTTGDEVPSTMRTLDEHFIPGTEKIQIDKFLTDGDDVIVIGSAGRTVKATNKRFTTPFVMHFTVVDGLIQRFFMYEETPVIEAAFK